MNHGASLSAPPRRTRRIVLLSLAILGMASAVLAALASRPWWRTTADRPRPAPAPAPAS